MLKTRDLTFPSRPAPTGGLPLTAARPLEGLSNAPVITRKKQPNKQQESAVIKPAVGLWLATLCEASCWGYIRFFSFFFYLHDKHFLGRTQFRLFLYQRPSSAVSAAPASTPPLKQSEEHIRLATASACVRLDCLFISQNIYLGVYL